MAALSALSAALSLVMAVILAAAAEGASFWMILIWVSMGGIGASVAYLLLFSNELKKEVIERAKIKRSKERRNREKFCQGLGVQPEE